MGSMKTSLLSLPLLIAGLLPAQAGEQDTTRIFASCAGRLSALMEFQWLTGEGDANATEARRATVLELLEAAMLPGEEREMLALRIAAKQAHAVLLTRALFNEDAADAAWAADLAAEHQGSCLAFLLS